MNKNNITIRIEKKEEYREVENLDFVTELDSSFFLYKELIPGYLECKGALWNVWHSVRHTFFLNIY